MANQMEVVIVVPRVVRDDAETMPMMVMMMVPGLGGQPMQAFAEERNAGESSQHEIAQSSSIL
jgi:hypothetical protein